MHWNRYYTSPSHSSTFIFGELCYKKPIEVTREITGVHDSYASYVSRQEGVLSEHTRYSEDERKSRFGYDFFTNKDNLQHYFDTTLEIIRSTDEYKQSLKDQKIESLTLRDILNLIKRAEPIYNRSMGYYFLSQPEYTAGLKAESIQKLKQFVPEEIALEVFTKLVESGTRSCLEEERRAWISDIVIPVKNGQLNKEQSAKRIETHANEYQYLSASAQFGLWDVKHFEKLLSDDCQKPIEKLEAEINRIDNKESEVSNEKNRLQAKYAIDDNLISEIQILADLGWLRLEAHLRGWQFFQWFGAVLVKQAAKAAKCAEEDIFNLTFSEFISFLKGEIEIDQDIIARRNGDILVIVTPENGEEIYFGKEATEKYNSDIAEEVEYADEFGGQTANGTGTIQGEAFVFKWGGDDIEKQIYDFPDGAILVAGQTLPLFMPAIRKASAIITDEGGVLCHAAIVSRELDKPAIIGTKVATSHIKTGDRIELDLDKEQVRII